MNSKIGQSFNRKYVVISGNQANINATKLRSYNIQLPTLKIQHKIVEELEKERLMVEQQKELIKYFEQKIQDRLNLLWESQTNNTDNKELVVDKKVFDTMLLKSSKPIVK